MLSKMFGRSKPPASPSPYELAMARGREEIVFKTATLQNTFGLGTGGAWAADLDTGMIRFDLPDGIVLTAPVQIIGTFDQTDGSWMWGWEHPSVPEPLQSHARTLRRFGEEHGIADLTTHVLHPDEADIWDYTALALHLAGAQGAYRGPAGTTLIMMTFGTVTAKKV